ncbi:MAG: hypothetical protein WBW75_20470 [Mycobacterium sp.]|uniref:hypothetical protein n=1 Tax=Mycobacterium sp. TaxID=1785 RepID=UPI003C6483FB
MEFNKGVAIAAIAGTLAVGLAGEAGAASGTMFGDPRICEHEFTFQINAGPGQSG